MPSCSWTTHMVGRHRELHAIIVFEQHTLTNDIGCGMLSSPLDNKNGRMTVGVHAIISLGQYTQSNNVGSGMPSSPLGSTHGRMTSGVACHHCPWTAHTVGRRRAWHEISVLGLHLWSDYVGRGMTSPPLDSTHGRTKRGMA